MYKAGGGCLDSVVCHSGFSSGVFFVFLFLVLVRAAAFRRKQFEFQSWGGDDF